jgi:hypothetical protein
MLLSVDSVVLIGLTEAGNPPVVPLKPLAIPFDGLVKDILI